MHSLGIEDIVDTKPGATLYGVPHQSTLEVADCITLLSLWGNFETVIEVAQPQCPLTMALRAERLGWRCHRRPGSAG